MSSEKKKIKSELPAELNQRITSLLQFATKAGKILFGHDIVVRNLESGKIRLVILSKDLSASNKTKIISLCEAIRVPCFEWGYKKDSLKFNNRETAIIGIIDHNFANGIENCLLYKEVEE